MWRIHGLQTYYSHGSGRLKNSRLVVSFHTTHSQRELRAPFAGDTRPRQDSALDLELRVRSVLELELEVLDEDTNHGLHPQAISTVPIHPPMTHLKLGQCEVAPDTDARAVCEGEEVPVTLDFLRCLRDAVGGEPPLGLELLRIGAPQRDGSVHCVGRHEHDGAFGHGDGVDGTAVGGA